jgi:DNA-binding NarL/FixJ family response regulator
VDNGHIQVVLVEDHAPLRDILLEYIGQLACVVDCEAFANGEAALSRLQDVEDRPDLLLVDLSLPGMSGIELVRAMRAVHPDLPCVILSGHRSVTYVSQAFAAGALGYILKGDPREIERGIEAVLRGDRFVSEDLTKSP